MKEDADGHVSVIKNRREDKMFGFGFDDARNIFQTRGYPANRDMSQYLIENRIDEIKNSFS